MAGHDEAPADEPLAARERQVRILRAELAGETARADQAQASLDHYRESADGAVGEAAAQLDRAQAREAELLAAHEELVSVHAALAAERRRADELEQSRSVRLARGLRRLRRPRG